MFRNKRFQSGLSMIEVLIIVAIVAILIIIAVTTLPQQITKSRDSRRKNDLQKIKIAFENYYNDKDCYPPPEVLDNCGSTSFAPYLATIPCDPQTKTRYLYAPEPSSCPHYYRVFSSLEVGIDPIITQLGCHTASGCGAYAFFGEELGLGALEYNYGVSEGVPVYVSDGNIPPGTQGFCCSFQGDQCNGWTVGQGVCNSFHFNLSECNAACGYQP